MGYTIENYELEYQLFLAENEFFDSMINIGSSIVNENSTIGLYAINESIKETIMKYIEKVVKGIEAAWNKIKEIFNSGMDYLQKIVGQVKAFTQEPKFTIDNYKIYDDGKFESIRLIEFNYDAMKPTLDSQSHFLSANYGSISGIGADGANIKETVEKYVITEIRQNYKLSIADIQKNFQWILTDCKKNMTSVENDIKSINNSNNNIQNIVNTIVGTATSEAVNFYYSFINEADDDKMKFNDAPEGENNNDQNKSDNNAQITKEVQVYISSSIAILTAKLNILKDRRKDYLDIIKHLFPEKNVKSDQPNNNPAQQNQDNSKTQVQL